jgi:hypothetical protein
MRVPSRAAVAVLAAVSVSGTALAASTRDDLSTTMGGSPQLTKGGHLELITQRVKKQFRVTIKYRVTVRSKTVLEFAAYPCRTTKCSAQANKTKITLGPGNRRVKYTGYVPVVQASSQGKMSRFACVYVQLRDRGRRDRAPGRIVRAAKARGLLSCQTVAPPAARR